MTHVIYLVFGYGLTTAVLGGYAGWLLHRERVLTRERVATSTE